MNCINKTVILKTKNKDVEIFIEKVIGEGKTSTVFLVHILGDDKQFALKIQEEKLKDIITEKISNRCKYLPYIYDTGKVFNSYASLIEFYKNTIPLNNLMMKGNKVLSFSTVLRLGLLMLPVLKDLHEHYLEYPDLSPSNIACVFNENSLLLKLYDCDSLRLPSNIYNDKVGKQHESFYSCIECKHTFADDLCSLCFVMITLLGGTFWNYKHIVNIAQHYDNPFFTRFNQLSIYREDYSKNKYDNSSYKNEYRRLINCIKTNVYNSFIDDISELINITSNNGNLNHILIEDMIKMNFNYILKYLCKKYNVKESSKTRITVGLYLIAIYITEFSYIGKNNIDELYNFFENSIKILNIYKINNLDKTKLIYDNKINLFDIGYDRIYK